MTAHLVAFVFAAGLLTITPGLDTLMVLRASTLEGRRAGVRAMLGITLGVLFWGLAVALGLAALLAASRAAYAALKIAGAIYLVVLGLRMIVRPKAALATLPTQRMEPGGAPWLRRGLLGNLLNPKMGVFYISFLPQFVPPGAPLGPMLFGLACIHAALGVIWCTILITLGARDGRGAQPAARGADRRSAHRRDVPGLRRGARPRLIVMLASDQRDFQACLNSTAAGRSPLAER